MSGRLWLGAVLLSVAFATAAPADEPVLLNADQISFQLSRTRSMRGVVLSLPAVTFAGATDRLTEEGTRQLETFLEVLKRPDQITRTMVIRAAPAPAGPTASAERRAAAVRAYLVGKGGLDPARVGEDRGGSIPPPRNGIEIVLGR